MTQHKLTLSHILLIVINLVPVLGVWFQGWEASRIFLFYCLETILIGIFHVFKMIIALILSNPAGDEKIKKKGGIFLMGLFIVLFFILHYGIFVFVQTSMFFGISGLYDGTMFGLNIPTLKKLLGPEGMLMMAIFTVYYVFETTRDMVSFRISEMSDLVKMMFQPYLRIFIQQFVLIIGSIFLLFKLGSAFILVFVLTKFYIEIFLNWNEKIDASFQKLKEENKELPF